MTKISTHDFDQTQALGARLDRLERLAGAMDTRFHIPGTGIRFGWDSIIGLVPGVGDIASLGPAGYILLEAHRMGAPAGVKARMLRNSGIDWLVGSVPVLGDLLDVWLKSNRRNVALLRAHYGIPANEAGRLADAAHPARPDVRPIRES